MTQKQNLRITLILGLFFLSLGGWLLHLKVHSPATNSVNYIPFIIGLIGMLIIPWLFFFKRWVSIAYLLNGMSVIMGIILMAVFSMNRMSGELSIRAIMLETTLADIVILFGKFTLGKTLFDLEFTQLEKEVILKFKFVRYPNMGWWIIHLVAIGIVYIIGLVLL
jgi:hypothetical protein